MRKYAVLKNPDSDVKKIMLFESSEGIYIFLYNTTDDYPSFADNWYDTLEDAEDLCKTKFHINQLDWILINDPLEDWRQ